jgi:hypothetical protein
VRVAARDGRDGAPRERWDRGRHKGVGAVAGAKAAEVAPPAGVDLAWLRCDRNRVLGAAVDGRDATAEEREDGRRRGAILRVTVAELPVLAAAKGDDHRRAAGHAAAGRVDERDRVHRAAGEGDDARARGLGGGGGGGAGGRRVGGALGGAHRGQRSASARSQPRRRRRAPGSARGRALGAVVGMCGV